MPTLTKILKSPYFYTLFVIGIVVPMQSIQGQVLECRDSSGKKLFATSCPKGYTKAREVEILSPPTETKEARMYNEKSKKHLQDREMEFKARQTQRLEADANERDVQRANANKCAEDRKKLGTILVEGPQEIGKNSDGTPIYMEEKKRLELIESLTEKLKKCTEE